MLLKSYDILRVCISAVHHYLHITTFAQHWINGKVIMEVTQGELSPGPQEHQMGDHFMPRAAASSLILCWIGDIFCCIRTVSFACVHLCLQKLKRCVRTLSGGSVHDCVHVRGQWTCCRENSCQGSGVSDDGRAFLSVCVWGVWKTVSAHNSLSVCL